MSKHKERNKRIIDRNKKIRNRYNTLTENYPYWKERFIIEKLSDEFYLSPSTIEDILYLRGVYSKM